MGRNGADALLNEVLDRAIKRTAEPFAVTTEGVCKAHSQIESNEDILREASHALLLCRQDDRRQQPETTRIGFGPFKIKTNSSNADWIYRLVVSIIGMIVLGWVAVQVMKIEAEVAEAKVQAHANAQRMGLDVVAKSDEKSK